ncbi:hypothetical protein ACKKBG_A24575 [Auxenochlorella protothecoides x Auxenochlorella symbiontica]
MTSRSRRERKPSSRLELAIEGSSREAPPKVMYVYRLMKPSEIKSTLVSRTVYVLWPDEEQANATWYRARVDECKVASKKGDLYYEDTDELETGADLADLVYQGHIAFREPRPLHHDLGRDEVGLDAPYTGRALEERLGHLPVTAASASPESSISDAGARDNSAEDSDFEVEAARERQSGSKRRRASTGEEDSDGEQDEDADGSGSDEVPLVARAAKMERRRASRGGARGHDDEDDDDEDAAERAAQKLLRQAQGGASGTPRSKPQSPSDFYGSGTPRRHQADHLSDAGVQEKVRQGLEQALELAVGEAAVRGEQCPLTSGQVAAAVEAALFRLHGGTSREYKTRYRTLQFNLKDPANPDLRGEVMAGRLAPEKLVTLSATELANKELTEYRRRKEEEALKMAVLDAEAAARFSTAAALETRESQPRKEAQEAAVREARGGEAARAVGEGAEAPDAGSSPPAEEPGAGGAAGDAVAGAASMDAGVLDHDRNPVPELEPGADVAQSPPARPAPSLDWAQIKASAVESAAAEDAAEDAAEELEGFDGWTAGREEEEGPGDAAARGAGQTDGALPPPPPSPLAHLFSAATAGSSPAPGAWRSNLVLPGEGSVLVTLEGLAGAVSPALLLGDRDVEVRGRVTLARLEEFLLDLRHSRHRAVSAGVAGLAPGATPREAGLWADLLALYRARGRTGVAAPQPGVEAYVLAAGDLAARVLEVAAGSGGAGAAGALRDDQALVLLIHKKDWRPEPGARVPVIRGRAAPDPGRDDAGVAPPAGARGSPAPRSPAEAPTHEATAPAAAAGAPESTRPAGAAKPITLPAGIDWGALSALAASLGQGAGAQPVAPIPPEPAKRRSRWESDAGPPAAVAADTAGWKQPGPSVPMARVAPGAAAVAPQAPPQTAPYAAPGASGTAAAPLAGPGPMRRLGQEGAPQQVYGAAPQFRPEGPGQYAAPAPYAPRPPQDPYAPHPPSLHPGQFPQSHAGPAPLPDWQAPHAGPHSDGPQRQYGGRGGAWQGGRGRGRGWRGRG